jgi:uncharacterized membrane protein
MKRKSIWAVIAGLLLLSVLTTGADILLRAFFPKAFGTSGVVESWFAAIATITYAAVFNVLSSYLTARLAGSRPMMHAIILGGVVFVISVLGELAGSWQSAPAWFNLGFLAMILPSVWLGGFVRARQLAV